MNPYASFLGEREPIAVIAGTANRLNELAARLGAAGVGRKPAAGKWSAHEVICHLADTETVFAFRLRQALAEDNHVIQPFDQEKWHDHYAAYTLEAALTTFATVRAWNLALIRALPAEAFSRELSHPERGRMTFRVLVETMAGHDLNHIRQIEAVGSAAAAVV